MNLKLSKISKNAPASPIRKLVPYAQDAKKKGIKIYHLNIGDPDIETPKIMIDYLNKWTKNPISYPTSRGEPEILDAMISYYKKIGINDLKHENLIVTFGSSGGLIWTFLNIFNPGDELICFEPFYANYNTFACVAGVNIVAVTTKIENNFHLPDISEIEKKITKKTKAILICNPSNPTGTIFTKEELQQVLNIAKKHNLYLISDEVYREFSYDGKKVYSMLDFKDQYKDGIIVCDSLSKRYSLCGARVGFVVTYNQEFMEGLMKFAAAGFFSALIDQYMGAQLTKVTPDYFEKVNKEYKARRDLLFNEIKRIEGVICEKPEGAFYMMVKLPVANAEDFAKWLLTDFSYNGETVMISPAEGFYKTKGLGKNEVRLAYVIKQPDLKRSVEILSHALSKYKNK